MGLPVLHLPQGCVSQPSRKAEAGWVGELSVPPAAGDTPGSGAPPRETPCAEALLCPGGPLLLCSLSLTCSALVGREYHFPLPYYCSPSRPPACRPHTQLPTPCTATQHFLFVT